MKVLSLFDVVPEPGSVFVDNLMVCSVERLLGSRYEALRTDPVFGDGRTAATLVAHDVLNLAAFLDTLICSERIYVNAAFLDRWSAAAEEFLDRQLGEIITGVEWPKGFQWEMETHFVRRLNIWDAGQTIPGIDFLAGVVSRSTHCPSAFNDGYILPGRARPISFQEVRRRLFMPEGEASRPYGSGGVEIGVGTGFYTACSEVLGVPYRPSVLRAQLLSRVALRYLKEWRFRAGGMILDMLSRDRDKLVRDALAPLVEVGSVELNVPATLALALQQVRTVDDILPWACRLKNKKSAIELRRFLQRLYSQVSSNNLVDVMESVRSMGGATKRVHQEFGYEKLEAGTVSLAFGPTSFGRDVTLPTAMIRRLPTEKRFWLIQDLQRAITSVARWSDPVDDVIIGSLPQWFQTELRKPNGLDWRVAARSIQHHGDIYSSTDESESD
jgi:hypothetical protein